jgi:hypothetical protein
MLVENHKKLTFAAMMHAHLKTAWAALLVVCLEDEAFFDDYNPLFADIVDMAEFLLTAISSKEKSKIPKFCFDSCVVIPLYMTGFKCRDSKTRRKAISLLLDYPRREGVWDSVLAGKMAEWAMSIEEENGEDGQAPGWARIHGVMFERDTENRSALLPCEQPISEGSDEYATRKKSISW